MCQQAIHKPNSPLRRTPRLHPSRQATVLEDAGATSRQLVFLTAHNVSDGAIPSQPIGKTSVLRRMQVHESADPINIPTLVDPCTGAATASYVATEGRPSSTQCERIASQQTSHCAQPSFAEVRQEVSRSVQLQSSVEPVSFPTSVEILSAPFENSQSTPELWSDVKEPSSSLPDAGVAVPRQNSPRGAELIVDEDEHERLRASQGDDKAGLFTFLNTMSVRELQKLLKSMKLKQQGNKQELVDRILVSKDIRMTAGDTISEIMSSHHSTARYSSLVQHQRALDEKVPQYWSAFSSLSQLLLMLGNRESEEFRRKKSAVLRSRLPQDAIADVDQQAVNIRSGTAQNHADVIIGVENINFSISEFARLCVIIRDDEDAKAALLATGKELTRSQMDAGFSHDSFWGVIEGRFNDPSLRIRLGLVGNVDDVDSTQPSPCHPSASFLKHRFFDTRSSFTVCVENWSKSGQNETTNFKSFAGTRNGELTATGKRNMVLFFCARLGTENEDSRFRSICLRTVPYGGGVDEGGSSAPSRQGSRRHSGAENDSVDQSVVQLSEYIIERGRQRQISNEKKREERRERQQLRREQYEEKKRKATEQRENRKRKSGDNRGLQQLEENHKLIKLLQYTTETLKSQGQNPGTELVVAARRQHEAIFKAFRMPGNSLKGLQGDISLSDSQEHNLQVTREGCRNGDFSSEQILDAHRVGERGGGDDEILPNV